MSDLRRPIRSTSINGGALPAGRRPRWVVPGGIPAVTDLESVAGQREQASSPLGDRPSPLTPKSPVSISSRRAGYCGITTDRYERQILQSISRQEQAIRRPIPSLQV